MIILRSQRIVSPDNAPKPPAHLSKTDIFEDIENRHLGKCRKTTCREISKNDRKVVLSKYDVRLCFNLPKFNASFQLFYLHFGVPHIFSLYVVTRCSEKLDKKSRTRDVRREQKPLPEDQTAGATGKRTVTMTENENSLEHRALAMTGNKNALKHGAFAEAVILPQEDPKEFAELLSSLHNEWNPEGATEIDKVNSIAMGLWRKRRFKRYIQNLVAIVAAFARHRKRKFNKLLDVLEEIEQAIETGELGAINEQNLSEKLRGLGNYIKKAFPRKNYRTDAAWLSAIDVCLTDLLQARLEREWEERTIDQEMSDEVFADREQAFEERTDAKIDKDIKALGQIKTMKAIGIGRRRAPVGIDPPKVGIDPPRLTGAPPILIGKREEDNPE